MTGRANDGSGRVRCSALGLVHSGLTAAAWRRRDLERESNGVIVGPRRPRLFRVSLLTDARRYRRPARRRPRTVKVVSARLRDAGWATSFRLTDAGAEFGVVVSGFEPARISKDIVHGIPEQARDRVVKLTEDAAHSDIEPLPNEKEARRATHADRA